MRRHKPRFPERADWRDILEGCESGHIIAFSGTGAFSQTIKVATRSSVSHVGICVPNRSIGEIYCYEAVSAGVVRSQLSDLIAGYEGEMWWLALADQLSAAQETKLVAFLEEAVDTEYDISQAVRSALDFDIPGLTKKIGHNREDYKAFFCSELCAAALKAAGLLPKKFDASEATPIDVCRLQIYRNYWQIRGEKRVIRTFNAIPPNLMHVG